jgi:hypothetical protein
LERGNHGTKLPEGVLLFPIFTMKIRDLQDIDFLLNE